MSEVDWREIFRVEATDEKGQVETGPGECNANCLEAKEIKCVCRCQGKNHGARLKEHVAPLDATLKELSTVRYIDGTEEPQICQIKSRFNSE